MQSSDYKGVAVTGVIGDDVHVIGIRVLEHALRAAGFKVVALGVQVSQEEFVNAAVETNAQVVLVSSLNGHAHVVASGLREKCIEAGLKNIRLYVGGMLSLNEEPWEVVAKRFAEMGFDGVYSNNARPAQIIADLERDLGIRGDRDGNKK